MMLNTMGAAHSPLALGFSTQRRYTERSQHVHKVSTIGPYIKGTREQTNVYLLARQTEGSSQRREAPKRGLFLFTQSLVFRLLAVSRG